MLIECPECGSNKFRFQSRHSIGDRVLRWLGWYRFYCHGCEARFRQHVLVPQRWIYAKCPRCYRLDLSSWDPRHYHARGFVKVKLALGARRMRCEKCRCNFASFRLRREWYRRVRPAPPAAQDEQTETA